MAQNTEAPAKAGRPAATIHRIEKLPASLPDGIVTETVKATIRGAKDVDGNVPKIEGTIDIDVPVLSAAGINAFIKYYNENGPASDDSNAAPYGIEFVAGAIRSAVRSGVGRLLTPETLSDSRNIIAPVSDIRTVDKFAAVGARAADAVREAKAAGRKLSEKEILAMFKDVMA